MPIKLHRAIPIHNRRECVVPELGHLILPEWNSGIPDSGVTRFRGRIPPQPKAELAGCCFCALPTAGIVRLQANRQKLLYNSLTQIKNLGLRSLISFIDALQSFAGELAFHSKSHEELFSHQAQTRCLHGPFRANLYGLYAAAAEGPINMVIGASATWQFKLLEIMENEIARKDGSSAATFRKSNWGPDSVTSVNDPTGQEASRGIVSALTERRPPSRAFLSIRFSISSTSASRGESSVYRLLEGLK